MPTKPRTKKPAAKPQRKTRAIREKTADALARDVADALGRRLDDLLSIKQDSYVAAWYGSDSAPGDWTVRHEPGKDGCVVASYAAAPPKPTSPIEEAVTRLLQAVNAAECLTDTTAGRLDEILSPPTLADATVNACGPGQKGASELAARLNGITDRIYADGRRRLDILNRLEL